MKTNHNNKLIIIINLLDLLLLMKMHWSADPSLHIELISSDKVKQKNWNKNNEINICLVSTTIFLGKKEHWFYISKHHNTNNYVLSIIDKVQLIGVTG